MYNELYFMKCLFIALIFLISFFPLFKNFTYLEYVLQILSQWEVGLFTQLSYFLTYFLKHFIPLNVSIFSFQPPRSIIVYIPYLLGGIYSCVLPSFAWFYFQIKIFDPLELHILICAMRNKSNFKFFHKTL